MYVKIKLTFVIYIYQVIGKIRPFINVLLRSEYLLFKLNNDNKQQTFTTLAPL